MWRHSRHLVITAKKSFGFHRLVLTSFLSFNENFFTPDVFLASFRTRIRPRSQMRTRLVCCYLEGLKGLTRKINCETLKCRLDLFHNFLIGRLTVSCNKLTFQGKWMIVIACHATSDCRRYELRKSARKPICH